MLNDTLAEIHPALLGVRRATENSCLQQHWADTCLNIPPEHNLVRQELGDKGVVQRKFLQLLILRNENIKCTLHDILNENPHYRGDAIEKIGLLVVMGREQYVHHLKSHNL